MPTEKKVKDVEGLRELIESCSSAISANYEGMTVDAMTGLRRTLREKGIRFRVVKNSLIYLAADSAGQPALKEIVQGPTGIAFGFDDPVEPARALTQFIRSTRSSLTIRGGLLDGRALTSEKVASLAALPPRLELLARLAGQLAGPITGLAYVLNGPVAALARVLKGRVEQLEEQGTVPESGSQEAGPATEEEDTSESSE